MSFIFFISLLLFTCPLYSRAEEGASAQTKDIQIIDNPYVSENNYIKNKADDYKIINVSIEDIKERFLKGEPVHFVGNQEEGKSTIKAEWINEALKKEYGVEKIDIENAVITGDLDFHTKENLVDIDESGMEEDEAKKQKDIGIEKVFLISSSINIANCQLKGNLNAGFDKQFKLFVIFNKHVRFYKSTVVKNADFIYASFNDNTAFYKSSFNGDAFFIYASFNDRTTFYQSSFNDKADFKSASFNDKVDFNSTIFSVEEANFRSASFNGDAFFISASFNGDAFFYESSFNGLAKFKSASFNDKADFYKSSFNGLANFNSASFNGLANFNSAIFNGWVYFRNSSFNGLVNFISASFNGSAFFSYASFNDKTDFRSISFNGLANFNYASFNGWVSFSSVNFKDKTDFSSAIFNGWVYFDNSSFNGLANFISASFNGLANFNYASLENVNLKNAVLNNSKFIDTNLKDAIMSGVDLTGSQYEPIAYPNKGSLERIKGLATVRFDVGRQTGLVKLRFDLKDSGLRDLEREATYAIEHWKAHWEPWYKKGVKYVLFESTCGYGLNYLRPLLILLVFIFLFSVPYMISLSKQQDEGIWMEWASERMKKKKGKKKPFRLKPYYGHEMFLYGLYFSLLSAFHIGWRDLNVGSWITRIQPREYTLKATGWVRVVSGVQSLISIYLLALWVLTQFGRPFD